MGINAILHADTTATDPKGRNMVYVFFGIGCASIEFSSQKWEGMFGGAWRISLGQLGFASTDAWLPIRGVPAEFYVFYGTQFGRINASGGQTVDGPWKITDKFTSLGKVGFDIIDAAINVPGKSDEVYFFRGAQYVKIHMKDDRVTSGPESLVKQWPGLTKAGFDSIDAAMPVAGKNDEFYFFRGEKVVKIKVTSGAPDQIVWGPESLLSTSTFNGAFRFLRETWRP